MVDGLILEIATPKGVALRMECEWVSAPSVRGEFGVLAGHLPLLAALKCGVLKAKSEGKERIMAIGPGFVSAQPEKVEVLTDLFAMPEKLDVEQVKKELAEAEGKLKSFDKEYEGAEHAELERDIDWALARLDAIAELED
jgi:F-type H+-transporting ATPase subunit epsilon